MLAVCWRAELEYLLWLCTVRQSQQCTAVRQELGRNWAGRPPAGPAGNIAGPARPIAIFRFSLFLLHRHEPEMKLNIQRRTELKPRLSTNWSNSQSNKTSRTRLKVIREASEYSGHHLNLNHVIQCIALTSFLWHLSWNGFGKVILALLWKLNKYGCVQELRRTFWHLKSFKILG